MRARKTLMPMAVALALAPTAAAAAATPEPIFPLSEVTPGMSCAGYSVFRGTEPSAYNVEIIDVIKGLIGATQTHLLVKVSGPQVEETGIAAGFSGSPVYCPDSNGTPRIAGALSYGIGEYGDKVGLATPIEAMINTQERGAPPQPAAATAAPVVRSKALGGKPKRLGHLKVRPLNAPMVVGGLSHPVAEYLNSAASPTLSRRLRFATEGSGGGELLARFEPQNLKPGQSLSTAPAVGDVPISAFGTVSYVEYDDAGKAEKVYAFGHPFDNNGPRSMFLNDSYVYRIIKNPGPFLSSYVMAGIGHRLGALTMDSLDAVIGHVGQAPRSIPVTVDAENLETGEKATLSSEVADESVIGDPSREFLKLSGLLSVVSAGDRLLKSAPPAVASSICTQIVIEGQAKPLQFCKRYSEPREQPVQLAQPATDVESALQMVSEFEGKSLLVKEVKMQLKIRRGESQASLRSIKLPARLHRGRTETGTMTIQHLHGDRQTLEFKVRVPRNVPLGKRKLEFLAGGEISTGSVEALVGALEETATPSVTRGPASLKTLSRKIRSIGKFDGVVLNDKDFQVSGKTAAARKRLKNQGKRVFRSDSVLINGRAVAKVKVVK